MLALINNNLSIIGKSILYTQYGANVPAGNLGEPPKNINATLRHFY